MVINRKADHPVAALRGVLGFNERVGARLAVYSDDPPRTKTYPASAVGKLKVQRRRSGWTTIFDER
jgi:hypothetical protein